MILSKIAEANLKLFSYTLMIIINLIVLAAILIILYALSPIGNSAVFVFSIYSVVFLYGLNNKNKRILYAKACIDAIKEQEYERS